MITEERLLQRLHDTNRAIDGKYISFAGEKAGKHRQYLLGYRQGLMWCYQRIDNPKMTGASLEQERMYYLKSSILKTKDFRRGIADAYNEVIAYLKP